MCYRSELASPEIELEPGILAKSVVDKLLFNVS